MEATYGLKRMDPHFHIYHVPGMKRRERKGRILIGEEKYREERAGCGEEWGRERRRRCYSAGG